MQFLRTNIKLLLLAVFTFFPPGFGPQHEQPKDSNAEQQQECLQERSPPTSGGEPFLLLFLFP